MKNCKDCKQRAIKRRKSKKKIVHVMERFVTMIFVVISAVWLLGSIALIGAVFLVPNVPDPIIIAVLMGAATGLIYFCSSLYELMFPKKK